MMEKTGLLDRRRFVVTAAVGAATCMIPSTAFGVTAAEKQAEADAVRNQLVGLNADLETASDRYHSAVDEREAAQNAMDAEQARIDETNARLDDIQSNLSVRARSMYRSGSMSFLDFILGAGSFKELTQNWDILTNLNDNDAKLVDEAKQLRESLEASKAEYARQEKIASDKAAEAKTIKDGIETQVAQANSLMETLDAEARALLEEEQRAAAIAAAQQKQAEIEAQRRPSNPSNVSGRGNGVDVPSQGSVVDYALSRIGCPYEWGGEGPNSFDCSGLVVWAYRQIGISLPHYTEDLYHTARQIVPVSEARPGDVLYRPGHVGIAVSPGGTHYVHAPDRGLLVRDTDSLDWSGFIYALRF